MRREQGRIRIQFRLYIEWNLCVPPIPPMYRKSCNFYDQKQWQSTIRDDVIVDLSRLSPDSASALLSKLRDGKTGS